ncbi:lysylphosphatidylglycerol synthase transmembrane domain-containing protein [Adhaeribacter radiodurans]|uniref:Flippase-like domain-containing protein n=1 Tax=Adhaeribacter radiodurans TaxID=2745197 RepID=A0A7L7LDX7_9BACT|nr:lysylphosphatidylglycerol synthase transmembrane domain-containing protein [Adhaeribacter radiodurans]QMU31011.1 flippase-like domain-containing protein [Adhaeribacter radiodurans]
MKKLLTISKYILLAGLSIFLMWFALKGIDFTLVWKQLQHVNYFWIGVSLLLGIAGYLSRAYRWKMQLEPLGYQLPAFKTYHAMMVGYLANLVLPRAGEVIRCSILSKTSNVAVKASFGTVITERLIDMLMLLLLTGAAFLIEFDRIHTFFWNLFSAKVANYKTNSVLLYRVGGAAILVFALALILLYAFRKKLKENSLYLKIHDFLKGVAEGVLSIAKLKNKFAFVAHTVFVWFTYYLTGYIGFLALPATENLSPGAALSVLVVGSLGMSAPVQGGIGVFHIMVRSTLLLYSLSKETGMAYALVTHTSQTLLVVILGGISFIFSMLHPASAKPVPLVPAELNPVIYDEHAK